MKRLSRGGIKGLNVELKEKNLTNNNEPNDFLDIIATENKINGRRGWDFGWRL